MSVERVSSSIYLTSRLVYICPEDYYHSIIPSSRGLHAYGAEPIGSDWIGATLRQGLRSASFTDLTPEEWDQGHYDRSCADAFKRNDEVLTEIAKHFRIRRKESVLSQALMVWVFWSNGLQGDDLELLATNHKRGGYQPFQKTPKYKNTRAQMRLDRDSDVEIGDVVRRLQAECLLSGKQASWTTGQI